ncbi:YrhK family protein [Curtobacterium sp. SL109]|uniref:YrhK family protein n=1 Tax=Curtobacterium sp. SL109 TaxID=2994662 RepID=UPI002276BE6D|nr:YrhK family protein [Curtobacterium sp. SL109]MCY1695075.1 YrhK family protein [Curtobacterium sp. SL109]
MADKPSGPLTLHIGDRELVIRKRYEVISILNDILIGLWFVVGSGLFFSQQTSIAATWQFLIGSIQMLIRPTIRLVRRVHLGRLHPIRPAETARDF